jgi:hypothetical protein
MFSGADSVRQSWLLALVWAAMAILVIAIFGPADLSRKHHKQEEPPGDQQLPPPLDVKPVAPIAEKHLQAPSTRRKE